MSLLTEAEVWAISVKGGGVYGFARLLEDAVIEKIKAQGAVAWEYPDLKTYSAEAVEAMNLNVQFALPLYALPEETK